MSTDGITMGSFWNAPTPSRFSGDLSYNYNIGTMVAIITFSKTLVSRNLNDKRLHKGMDHKTKLHQ